MEGSALDLKQKVSACHVCAYPLSAFCCMGCGFILYNAWPYEKKIVIASQMYIVTSYY